VHFERIGIVGCGVMGSGIAEICARAALDTLVVEVDDAAVDAGRRRIESSLARAVERGRLDEESRARALEHLSFTPELKDLADRDLVIEAIVESAPDKIEVLAQLDDIVGPEAVLASNTSSIPIGRLALATTRSERVVGLHFFNPVPVRPLVEVVPSLLTDQAVVDHVSAFAAEVLHRKVVRAPDRAGFIVNALLIPYLLSAIRMCESGLATAADIDAAMVEGCGHPMGPLALADLVGLDTTAAIAASMNEESRDPAHACPPIVTRMVEANRLGRKTGSGFYEYRQG
jgi:3-hydroxybutyryl-CoA dehydrogenase